MTAQHRCHVVFRHQLFKSQTIAVAVRNHTIERIMSHHNCCVWLWLLFEQFGELVQVLRCQSPEEMSCRCRLYDGIESDNSMNSTQGISMVNRIVSVIEGSFFCQPVNTGCKLDVGIGISVTPKWDVEAIMISADIVPTDRSSVCKN